MKKQSIKVLFAAYEVAPFFKFGGLGDVAGSLPVALKILGVDIRLIMPYYAAIKKEYPHLKKHTANLSIKLAGQKLKINIFKSNLPKSRTPIYFIDSPKHFQTGNIFDKSERTRFITFSGLIVELIQGDYLAWQPQIIHCNDWQTGIIPDILKQLKLSSIKTLFTIHNIGYAGRTQLSVLKKFGFDQKDFEQIKDDKVNLMRQGILSADKVSTVSPSYAKEILTRQYGYDMADALKTRRKDLSGILNGLDYTLWNPASDLDIKAKFSPKNIKPKSNNKLYLQKISGLAPDKDIPLIAMVSRLVGQKGFDLVQQALPAILKMKAQLVILGTGDKAYEEFFASANKAHPGSFKAHLKFDLKLARQIYAGADMFLMPSKYEPCGLGQLIAMNYGTIPIVRNTGGLKDTVVKTKTGFSFKEYTSRELMAGVNQALKVHANAKLWSQLIKKSMSKDFSWDSSAKDYLKLYKRMIK